MDTFVSKLTQLVTALARSLKLCGNGCGRSGCDFHRGKALCQALSCAHRIRRSAHARSRIVNACVRTHATGFMHMGGCVRRATL